MKRFALIGLAIAAISARAAAPDPVEGRVDALVSQMTLDEKLNLLGGAPDGGGFHTTGVPRLKIPPLTMSDGPQGLVTHTTGCAFPAGVALAATWDLTLAQHYGRALGLEGRAHGVHIQLGPGVNIARVPVNGRNFEYFGEDPFLAGKVAANWIAALQKEGVMATVKHYAANNQETHRMDVSADMDDRTLHEIYLPAFKRAIDEGGVWAVMSAYNRFRGEYCSGSEYLLDTVLKGELGFRGLVMSDWGAVHDSAYLSKGLDLEMPKSKFLKPDAIKGLLDKKEVDQARIDDAVRRQLRAYISLGFLDHEQKRPELPLDSPDSSATALEVARSGIVLLKNDGAVLPLDRAKIHRLAVYGPNARNTPWGGEGSGFVHPFHHVSFLDGIQKLAGPGVEIVEAPDPLPKMEEREHMPLVRTAANGPAGLNAVAIEEDTKKNVNLPTQSGVDLKWNDGELPFALEGGQVNIEYRGVLVAEEDGDWEIVASGRVKLFRSEMQLHSGDVLHLRKGEPCPIRVRANIRRAEGKSDDMRACWLTLRKPLLPDMAPAKSADAAVCCVGFSGQDTEGYDRDFELPEMQRRLLNAVSEANPHTIVTVNSGGGVGMAEWIAKTPAVLQTWYLGQEGGTALAETLFGAVNPSGRLPATFDRTFADCPAANDYPGQPEGGNSWPTAHYREGIFVGYRGYEKSGKEPMFPFGHGLSYTNFAWANLGAASAANGAVNVTLEVRNTGAMAGSDVVEIYVGEPKCSVERPVRELKGFAKVTLQPGETKKVEIALPADSFMYWSPAKKAWTLESGDFVIEAGHSSRDVPLKTSITLKG